MDFLILIFFGWFIYLLYKKQGNKNKNINNRPKNKTLELSTWQDVMPKLSKINYFFNIAAREKEIELLNKKVATLERNISVINEKNKQSEHRFMTVLKIIQVIKDNQNNFQEDLKSSSSIADTIDKRIDSLSGFFSVGKSLDADDSKKYTSINDRIIETYKSSNFRDFLDTFSDYKAIGLFNYDEIRNNSSVLPNFSEIATGQCIAVPIENDLYSIVIKKGLELKKETIESIGIAYIFELSEGTKENFFYSQWELIKLPIFQKLSNSKWVCLSKGFLKLTPESDSIRDNDNIDSLEDIEDSSIEYINSFLEDNNKIFESLKIAKVKALEEVKNFSQSIFISKNPETFSLMAKRSKNSTNLVTENNGNYLAFQPKYYDTSLLKDYYFMFPENSYIKSLITISKSLGEYKSMLDIEINKLQEIFFISYSETVSSTQLVKLAVIKIKKITKTGKNTYEIVEKGEIILKKSLYKEDKILDNLLSKIEIKPKTFQEELMERFNNMNFRDFYEENKGRRVDIVNIQDIINDSSIKPVFKDQEQGKYCIIPQENASKLFYLFPNKSSDIKIDNTIRNIFMFPTGTEDGYFSNWKITQPSIVTFDSYFYRVINKGKIDVKV